MDKLIVGNDIYEYYEYQYEDNFEKKIDFLYLDSLDGQFANASEHQLNEIKLASKNFICYIFIIFTCSSD